MNIPEEAKVEESVEQFDQADTGAGRESFRKELENLINRHSQEGGSDTPDFVLAEYFIACLEAFNKATRRRAEWYKGAG